ncbi:hypothetical protein ACTFSJ_27780 [Bacillus cereus group sp. MYBK12-2]|uniref:hypothetical protein n=1 Tax=Bacillus cereus group sp. MYBK12-2 TaxID=3450689 RepID=UPI0032F176A3|nr:hypothetical protein [Bacillus pacificus]HDR7653580.1 hypothetical protein [Bacillus pacificus]
MHEELLEFLKKYLKNVNSVGVQVDYFGNFQSIDLRKPAICIEPKDDDPQPDSSRWNLVAFNIRLWVMAAYDIDYMKAFSNVQKILTAEDQEKEVYGVHAILNKMKYDPAYLALSGKMAGKAWRVHSRAVSMGRTRYSIQQRASQKINTATLDVTLYMSVER